MISFDENVSCLSTSTDELILGFHPRDHFPWQWLLSAMLVSLESKQMIAEGRFV